MEDNSIEKPTAIMDNPTAVETTPQESVKVVPATTKGNSFESLKIEIPPSWPVSDNYIYIQYIQYDSCIFIYI